MPATAATPPASPHSSARAADASRRAHRWPRRRRAAVGALLAALALLVGLTACSDAPGMSDSGDAASRPAPDMGAGGEAAAAPQEGAAARDGGGEAQGGAPERGGGDEEAPADGGRVAEGLASAYGSTPEGTMVARDAEVELVVEELAPAATRVRAAAVAVDGFVLSEEIHPGPDDWGGHATLVLSVPSQGLDRALAQVAEIGEEQGRRLWSEDVTADYVDSSARVETLVASVERTRRLMQQAGSIEDVVALERELARREADLAALRAHVEALEEDVTRSTLTVHLAADTPEREAEPVPAGFMAGLDQGWTAFTAFVTAALTVVGVLLPFLLLGPLVLVPVVLLLRRRHPRSPARAG